MKVARCVSAGLKVRTIVAAAFIAFAATATSNAADTDVKLSSPVDLYLGAVSRLASTPQQPYLAYIMTHSQTRKGLAIGGWTDWVVERRFDRRSWNKTTAGTLIKKTGDVSIGRHYLIPDAFLPYRNETAPQGVLPLVDAPRLIGTVHSALSYTITLVAEETIGACGPVAHLSLRPLRNPERYNVRDMWVRRSDYRLCKATFITRLYQEAGTNIPRPATVTSDLGEDGLINRFSLFIQSRTIFGSESVTDNGTFSRVAWSSNQPSYLFDYASWKASGGTYSPVP